MYIPSGVKFLCSNTTSHVTKGAHLPKEALLALLGLLPTFCHTFNCFPFSGLWNTSSLHPYPVLGFWQAKVALKTGNEYIIFCDGTLPSNVLLSQSNGVNNRNCPGKWIWSETITITCDKYHKYDKYHKWIWYNNYHMFHSLGVGPFDPCHSPKRCPHGPFDLFSPMVLDPKTGVWLFL